MDSLTFDQLYNLPTVVDLMTAARALGIGRSEAYRLARDGQFPCRLLRVGTHYHIPTAELLKVLGATPSYHHPEPAPKTRTIDHKAVDCSVRVTSPRIRTRPHRQEPSIFKNNDLTQTAGTAM